MASRRRDHRPRHRRNLHLPQRQSDRRAAPDRTFLRSCGYTLQRYVQACGGRGAYPIKFNGGIFTVEPKPLGKPFNPDFRNWGDCHWWQNVRHMYHPMLAGGDFEMMQPLFNLYESVRPLCEARAKLYHNADGCYFPETMTVWGTYSNGDYGWNRTGHEPKEVLSPWWQYAWNQGPELVGLMLDRWDYTGDQQFLQSEALPMAESVLKYFDTRFHKTDDGKIILSPTQSVETYWNDVTNDMPCVAGLTDITTRLCALPEALVSPGQHTFFAKMKAACPAIPMETIQVNGQPVRKLAAAQSYRPQAAPMSKIPNCTRSGLSASSAWASPVWTRHVPPIRIASNTSTPVGATTATARLYSA